MHILLVKMSSMGDVIHTLPALTDAKNAIPDLTVDWVIEPAFADIPTLHASVSKVLPLPLRKWRKNLFKTVSSGAFSQFKNLLQSRNYDTAIDAQGLLKSAWITKLIKARSHGLDKQSAREPLASHFYETKHHIDKNQHAIERTRELFACALNYDKPSTPADYGIDPNNLPKLSFELPENYLVFLHSTTWATKQYPDTYWQALLNFAKDAGLTVYLPWGNASEKKRAEQLSKTHGTVLPKSSIAELTTLLHNASGVIAVDTGLGHLSAALNTPTISLYGPTNPSHVGTIGQHAINLTVDFTCAPCVSKICHYAKTHDPEITPACYTTLRPDIIWQTLQKKLSPST